MTIRRQHLLASTLFTAAALFAAPAFAQPASTTSVDTPAEDASTEVGAVIVTGTRIPKNEFNSAQPVQVLTSERAQAAGVSDTAQFLQSSTIAAGSSQTNPAMSSVFQLEGGPGASTLSLRGLGAQRTLILLNSRRAGPAGVRGEVGAFDLNVVPTPIVDRVDILKDGASSIYGSDAVAGVVNIITKRKRDGGEAAVFYTDPFDTGGQQVDVSLAYGRKFDRFSFNVAADWYKQSELAQGERDYTSCATHLLFNPNTGAREDVLDPRTGQPACYDNAWGQVWIYGGGAPGSALTLFSRPNGKYQFNYDSNLQNFVGVRPGTPNGVCAGASRNARSLDADCYPTAPTGFYVVGFDTPSTALLNANSPLNDAQSLIPQIERSTLYADGTFDLTSNIQLYAEVLGNQRKSYYNGYRQFWTYNTTPNYAQSGGQFFDSDSLAVGFSGPFILSPTPVTDWNDSSQDVRYARGVLGARGGFSAFGLKDWTWDIFGQYSRSDGRYMDQVIFQDAIDALTTASLFDFVAGNPNHTGPCEGQILPVSGRVCHDVNFYDPNFLAGNADANARETLFGVDRGRTIYTEQYLEGSVAGNLFDLPAGPLGAALGFHVQKDRINDTPGDVTLAGNIWGGTTSGITAGSSTMKEVFGELSVPLVSDRPLFQNVGVTLSGRYTDVDVAGTATTYKVGLNWQVVPQFKIRYTEGTSFRAPALYELYLANQVGFFSQQDVDPCIDWQQASIDGTIAPRIAANCQAAGVPGDFGGGGSSVNYTKGGGLGLLKPETSRSKVWGVAWTPKFIDLSLAVDYYEIAIKGEVRSLGSSIPFGCYNSQNFPADPICGLFDRDPNNFSITDIRDQFINVAHQSNRGIDVTARYRHTLPWQVDLTLDSQFTWILEDKTAVFQDFTIDDLGDIGHPQFVGRLDATFKKNDWQFVWGIQMFGEANNYGNLGSNEITDVLGTHRIVAEAPFVAYHHASVRKEWKDLNITVGVSNIFDEPPPQVSAPGSYLGQFETVGNSVLGSQYTEGYYGRRGFIRVGKTF
jgi:iron complex outermembrane receptor protein